MADAKAITQSAKIVLSDESRRYVVVSAPGKRNSQDHKVTDLLYACYHDIEINGECKATFDKIRVRFREIVQDLGLDFDIEPYLDKAEEEMLKYRSSEFCASRGEYLSAVVFSKKLGYQFVDAKDIFVFSDRGEFDAEATNAKVGETLKNIERAVIPGFFGADEMLYPEYHRFLSDLLSYVAVGARSVEDQEHRLVASGLDVPVGMKNPPSGDNSVMLNAIVAAQAPHSFIYRNWDVQSTGNPYAHAILRGYIGASGHNRPNYSYDYLVDLVDAYAARDIKNPALIVDCNHSNSNKHWDQQPRIAKDVLHSCRQNADIDRIFRGFMIESYLVDGAQKVGGEVYGQSITDPCLGWEKTEKLLHDIAELV